MQRRHWNVTVAQVHIKTCICSCSSASHSYSYNDHYLTVPNPRLCVRSKTHLHKLSLHSFTPTELIFDIFKVPLIIWGYLLTCDIIAAQPMAGLLWYFVVFYVTSVTIDNALIHVGSGIIQNLFQIIQARKMNRSKKKREDEQKYTVFKGLWMDGEV